MPRAAWCAEQVALLCSTVLCAFVTGVLRFDRQYGGNLRGGKNRGPWKIKYTTIHVEIEKRRKVAHQNNTYYTRYCFMFETKHTAHHDTAPQRRARQRTVRLRTAPHGATLRCWAICSRTDLSWACIVIQQRIVPDGMYKPGVLIVVPVCTISLKVFSLVRIPVSSGEKNYPRKKIKGINLTLWSR